MKKWAGGVLILGLGVILVVSYSFIGKSDTSKKQSAYDFFNSHPVEEQILMPNVHAKNELSESTSKGAGTSPLKIHFIDVEGLDELYTLSANMTKKDSDIFLSWDHMRFLFPRSDALPETSQGIKEGLLMWKDLILMIEEDNASKLGNDELRKACKHFVTASNTTLMNESFLEIPCGLVEDSSVTVIGIRDSREDSFAIELIGSQLKEELNPPIVLQYKVLLPGQNLTKEPVTIQNTWTQESGWGKEEKCPDHGATDLLLVDGLVNCNSQMIRRTAREGLNSNHPANKKLSNVSEGSDHASSIFQFLEGNPFTATIWSGNDGFHVTVNGRHETSFAYRGRLEPWLVNRVSWKGGLTTLSVLAKGLPVIEDVDLVADAPQLKSKPISNKKLLLLIGVFSSGNNFARRMALRRTWMQYDAVRSGSVAVRFFVGLVTITMKLTTVMFLYFFCLLVLISTTTCSPCYETNYSACLCYFNHNLQPKNKEVNFNLWREAQAYRDIQLMPFVDYYGLLTYKTIAICILGTDIHPAKYMMKMDDDAFVRIDEILSSLKGKPSKGLLYGHISFESAPQRDEDNKWFISEEEWPHSSYPPWAHGPGYIISHDIAKFVVRGHQKRQLMLFKLEDVAMGIWIDQYMKNGQKIEYVSEERFYDSGCESDYILAHYQNPRKILCMWEKLQKEQKAECCE